MEEPKHTLQAFQREVTKFSDTAHFMIRAWEKMDRVFPWLVNEINSKYPFNEDFYEVLAKIDAWEHHIRSLELPRGVLEWKPGEEES